MNAIEYFILNHKEKVSKYQGQSIPKWLKMENELCEHLLETQDYVSPNVFKMAMIRQINLDFFCGFVRWEAKFDADFFFDKESLGLIRYKVYANNLCSFNPPSYDFDMILGTLDGMLPQEQILDFIIAQKDFVGEYHKLKSINVYKKMINHFIEQWSVCDIAFLINDFIPFFELNYGRKKILT